MPRKLPSLWPRGVWQAPWWGENEELILVAVTSRHTLLVERIVAHGQNRIAAYEELWDMLQKQDPVSDAEHDEARRQTLRAV